MPNSPEQPNKREIVLSIELAKQKGKPVIQLRKIITNKEEIDLICKCALKGQPIPAVIKLRDPFMAFSRLKTAKLI